MGQFQPGQSKPSGSGRKRGTSNKKTMNLEATLESYGIDLVGQIAELLPQLAVDKRADVLLNLIGYIYPKRKAVETSVQSNQEFEGKSIKETHMEIAHFTRMRARLIKDPKLVAALEVVAQDHEDEADKAG